MGHGCISDMPSCVKHWVAKCEIGNLVEKSGLDDEGSAGVGCFVSLAAMAPLEERIPPFEFVFDRGDACPMYTWD